jgi:hypothetical protein
MPHIGTEMNRRSFLKFVAILAAVPAQVIAWSRNRIWRARDSAEFHHALRNANHNGGDIIVLSAGQAYVLPPGGLDPNRRVTIVSSDAAHQD